MIKTKHAVITIIVIVLIKIMFLYYQGKDKLY